MHDLGLVLDLGTSTLRARLIDLLHGECLAERHVLNPHDILSRDVISRVLTSQTDQPLQEEMTRSLREGVSDVISRVLSGARVRPSMVSSSIVVCNTVMHSLFLGLRCDGLLQHPYIVHGRRDITCTGPDLGIDDLPKAEFHIPAPVESFVGSDALAVALWSALRLGSSGVLSVDIGANTEISVLTDDHILFASVASGPAFEDMSIECGMPAADGAIHEVRLSDDLRPEYSVIGGQRPLGLCGSGVVSLLSEMRRVGILNEGGSIDRSVRSDRIGTIGHSAVFYVVYPDVYLSQLDIRMLQLSKAAVQAGILTLLNEAGYRCQDIRSTLITGAFGNALRIDDAIGIGMLPRLDRVVQRECAALDGATLMLIDDDARETADDLRRRSRHVSLRDNPVFEQLFEQSRVFAPWVSI